jgi:DNA-binding IclR family transcriptional regulator
VNVDLSELDAALEEFRGKTPLIVDRGFTVSELQKLKGMPRTTAERTVARMVTAGRAVAIGYRPGQGAGRVYELVKPAN